MCKYWLVRYQSLEDWKQLKTAKFLGYYPEMDINELKSLLDSLDLGDMVQPMFEIYQIDAPYLIGIQNDDYVLNRGIY